MTYSNRLQCEALFLDPGLSGDAVTATGNGTGIDLRGLANGPYQDGLLVVNLETITGGPSATSVKYRIEHSDDNSTFTPVTATETVEAATVDFTAVGVKTLAFRVQGLKRYVRVARSTVTLTGGSTPSVKVRTLLVLDAPRQF